MVKSITERHREARLRLFTPGGGASGFVYFILYNMLDIFLKKNQHVTNLFNVEPNGAGLSKKKKNI